MRNIGYISATALFGIFGLLLAYEGWFILIRFLDIISSYKCVGLGIVAFAIFHHFVEKNREFFETFSHELTHGIVAIVFFREIISFQVNKKNGVIWTRGNKWSEPFVSLAPYCIPIFTIIMLLLWSLVATRSIVANNSLLAFDIIIGMTVSFHFFCFKTQTGDFETDINQYPKHFAYSFIWFVRLLILLIVLLCYMPSFKTGHPLKLWGAIWYLIVHLWNDIIGLF